MREVTELDRYLFDLNGYIVVKGALTPQELDTVNREVDACTPAPTEEQPITATMHLFRQAQVFRDLIDHPSILPYLMEWIGPSVRIDDLCLSYLSIESEFTNQLGLHMGGTPYHPLAFYQFNNNRSHIGLTVVLWCLSDIPGDKKGGFCCIPGSHKSNYKMPAELQNYDNPHDCVFNVPVKAGDAIIFTEALTHARFPWRHSFQRRCLFYRYMPGCIGFEQIHYKPYEDELIQKLTPRQRQMFEPPYSRAVNFNGTDQRVNRGTISLDGSVVESSEIK